MAIIFDGLIDHIRMHLSQNDSRGLPGHVTRSDAMLHAIGGVRAFFHNADTATGEGDREGPIAIAIELASKGEAGV